MFVRRHRLAIVKIGAVTLAVTLNSVFNPHGVFEAEIALAAFAAVTACYASTFPHFH